MSPELEKKRRDYTLERSSFACRKLSNRSHIARFTYLYINLHECTISMQKSAGKRSMIVGLYSGGCAIKSMCCS